MKFRLRFLCRQFDHIHLVQLLLSGHRHISGRYTCLITCHEIFQLTDLLLLSSVSGFQLRFLHCIDFLEVIIISHITVQFLILHMINDIYNFI